MNKKWLVGAVAGVFLLGNVTGAWAGTAWKEVKALFNPSIQVELNGQEMNNVQALQYNGSIYLQAKSISSLIGLDSKFMFDNKTNKLTIGGPRYLYLLNPDSKHLFQIAIPGNWNPTIVSEEHLLYSNYYMGVEFSVESAANVSLDDYVKQTLNASLSYAQVNKQTKTKIAGAEARVMDYKTNDSTGKLAFVQKGSDIVTLMFFVDKTRYKASDLQQYDKIIASFTIS